MSNVMTREELIKEMKQLFDAEQMDGEEIVETLEEWMEECDKASETESIRGAVEEKVRIQAVDEGCELSDVEELDFEDVAEVASWDTDELAEVIIGVTATVALEMQMAGALLAHLGDTDDAPAP